ncbi:MAG: glycosyl hydrolase, partial [Chitinophagaceae bacterium]
MQKINHSNKYFFMSGLKIFPGIILCLTLFCVQQTIAQNKTDASINNLKKAFAHPPDSVKTSIYWYWISDNISKEGVIRDLKAMKQAGINRAFIGNIGLPEVAYGKVKIFSDEWWDILHTALKTATELNIEIGIFNSPGWSQSGGPWVKPSQSMRYLTSSDTLVKGPMKFLANLAVPEKDFQDVKLIAFKTPADYGKMISVFKTQITSTPEIPNVSDLFDGRQENEVLIKEKQGLIVDI